MIGTLPRIYPITDTHLTGLSHTEQVRRLIAGGATMVQLREKRLTPRAFYEDARAAVEVARASGVKILINDRVDVAMAVGADGVHLGQDDLAPDRARCLLGSEKIIGYSTHSVTQALEASTLQIDYLAIGPVFATVTKENPWPVVGIDCVADVRAAVGDFPLVAIGGINVGNLGEVLERGADAVAMIGAILTPTDDITARFKRLLDSA